jgi:hypothetical protein
VGCASESANSLGTDRETTDRFAIRRATSRRRQELGRRGRVTFGDAARLFRDVAAERPIWVIRSLAIVTYVLLRYGLLRSAGAVMHIAGQAATLAGEAGGI